MELLKALGVAYVTISTVCFTLFLIGLFRNIRKELSGKSAESNSSEILSKMRLVYVEEVCGMYHLYDKINNSFIAQGYTEDEMWTKAEEQYPNLKFFETTKEADFAKDE